MATNDIRRAARIDIKYNIRESFSWSGTVTDSNGDPVDLSGKTLIYSIRTTEGGTALTTITDGITVSGASNNIVTISAESITGIVGRSYYHDLENTTDNEMVFDGRLIATYGAYGD